MSADGAGHCDHGLHTSPKAEGQEKTGPFRLWTASEWALRDPPAQVVEGVFCEGDFAMVYGGPGVGKSLLGLDLGYRIGNGEPWCGRKTRGGPVVYVAAEGQWGLIARIRAWTARNGTRAKEPFILPHTVNLFSAPSRGGSPQPAPDVTQLIERLDGLPEPPKLIIFDTLAASQLGADENVTRDAGLVIAQVRRLIERYRCVVAVIHHEGKNKKRGSRGASAYDGAVDVKIKVVRGKESNTITLTSEKARDLPPFNPITLAITPVGLGDGLTSAVAVWEGDAEQPTAEHGAEAPAKTLLPRREGEKHVVALVMTALRLGPARRKALKEATAALVPSGSFNRSWGTATKERRLLVCDTKTKCYAVAPDVERALRRMIEMKKEGRLKHVDRGPLLTLRAEDFTLTQGIGADSAA